MKNHFQTLPKMRARELEKFFQTGNTKLLKPRSFEKENLSGLDFHNKDLSGCDFTGAIFSTGQDFSKAVLENCTFGPEREGLMPVAFRKSNFSECILRSAQLKGISLIECDLLNADLTNANLNDTDCHKSDFSYANMFNTSVEGANFFQARFYKTRLNLIRKPILQANRKSWANWCELHGYPYLEEIERIEQSISVYLELKENFRSIGAYSDASWAYIQERRMRRQQYWPFVASSRFKYPNLKILRFIFYLWSMFVWFIDFLVDLTTGYGESLFKTLLTIIITTTIIFPLLYGFSGGITVDSLPTRSLNYYHLILFSVGNLIQGYPGMEAYSEIGTKIHVFQQLFGVLAIGFLGFVLGNKINQS